MKFKENQLERLIEGCYGTTRQTSVPNRSHNVYALYISEDRSRLQKLIIDCVGRYGDQPRKECHHYAF